jgi:N,N-dimethylformamidase
MIALAGYADRLSVRPGETIEFKVSSAAQRDYKADLVRIVCADPNPAGPGIIEHSVPAAFAKSYPSRVQEVSLGSYVRIDETEPLDGLESLTLLATIWPTRLGKRAQGVISRFDPATGKGFSLGISEDGRPELLLGRSRNGPLRLTTDVALEARAWVHVWATFDAKSGDATVGFAPVAKISEAIVVEERLKSKPVLVEATPLLIAATGGTPVSGPYNGKIEHPRIFSRALSDAEIAAALAGREVSGLLAHWNFTWQVMSNEAIDVGPHAMIGRLVNCPTRAMTGHNWTGREMCWRHAPDEYGAIHFHEDDIADCGWKTDFSFTVPNDLRSGLYAARLKCGIHEERIPFVVCPPRGRKRADICVLVSTFTYVVYANHARPTWSDDKWRKAWQQRTKAWKAYPHNPGEHRQYGLSTYNFHTDHSGVAYSSMLRPMLNVRPGYVTYPEPKHGSGLRHLPADTHLTAWLEHEGLAYDMVTDWELHTEGYDVLAPYRVVLTGSHPEYHTRETLDALETYRDRGGRFCYLGGNGFYWKVALSSQWPGVIEIRRGEGGIRAWAAEAGEYYNAFDGEYGGLWRRNGRPPQNLSGVGFTAQGDFIGSYYRRRPEADDKRVSWMFKGIRDKKLGDFGLSGEGAAGFELDRTDKRLGTPKHALVVAASEGHEPETPWVLVPEEMLTHITTVPGERPQDLIRADLTFFETPAGGAVFSTGSIAFCGSLPWNGYDNNVAKLMRNVIDRFLDPEPFVMPKT